jgi:hypothetical protein
MEDLVPVFKFFHEVSAHFFVVFCGCSSLFHFKSRFISPADTTLVIGFAFQGCAR